MAELSSLGREIASCLVRAHEEYHRISNGEHLEISPVENYLSSFLFIEIGKKLAPPKFLGLETGYSYMASAVANVAAHMDNKVLRNCRADLTALMNNDLEAVVEIKRRYNRDLLAEDARRIAALMPYIRTDAKAVSGFIGCCEFFAHGDEMSLIQRMEELIGALRGVSGSIIGGTAFGTRRFELDDARANYRTGSIVIELRSS